MSDQVQVSGPMYRPSRDDGAGIDAGTRKLLYLMGGGGLAILVAIAGYSLLGHSGPATVPVVQADQGPVRVKPENPGGMAVAQGVKAVDPNDSHLAPPTEEPNPRALQALTAAGKGPAAAPVILAAHPKPVTVQLSEVKSEADAKMAWGRLEKRLPDLFAQRQALFQKANGGPLSWKLRTGGFSDAAQAKTFCDKLKAKGISCSLVDS